MHTFTPEEIVKHLKSITGDKFDSDLAKRLEIDKQSIPQYKRRKGSDIQLKMISLLISRILNEQAEK